MAWRILSGVGTTAVAVGTTGVAVSEAGKNYKRRGSCTAIFRGPARREDSAGRWSSPGTFLGNSPAKTRRNDPPEPPFRKNAASRPRRKRNQPGHPPLALRV